MTVWRPFIRVYMWQACIFWTCNCYKTRIEWKIDSSIRRKKNRNILWCEFRIAIRYKFLVYCDIPIYRYIVTPLVKTRFLSFFLKMRTNTKNRFLWRHTNIIFFDKYGEIYIAITVRCSHLKAQFKRKPSPSKLYILSICINWSQL